MPPWAIGLALVALGLLARQVLEVRGAGRCPATPGVSAAGPVATLR